MGASDDQERLSADLHFGAGAVVIATVTYVPATWYLGLSTTQPNDDGTGFTEPVGFNYGRVAAANNGTTFPAATTVGGVTTKRNGAALTFPVPSGLWGVIGWWGWFSTATLGTPKFTGPLDTPITVQNGNSPVEFADSMLVIPWD